MIPSLSVSMHINHSIFASTHSSRLDGTDTITYSVWTAGRLKRACGSWPLIFRFSRNLHSMEVQEKKKCAANEIALEVGGEQKGLQWGQRRQRSEPGRNIRCIEAVVAHIPTTRFQQIQKLDTHVFNSERKMWAYHLHKAECTHSCKIW